MRGHRLAVLALGLILLCTGVGQAQDDDGWGEITGLMNGLTGINQQLAGAGVQWQPGRATSGSQYIDNLAYWCQVYAQLLGSIDQAFADGVGGPGGVARDPLDPQVANVLRWQLWQMQTQRPDVIQAYQNNLLFQMQQE
jgi:hypothetical protein